MFTHVAVTPHLLHCFTPKTTHICQKQDCYQLARVKCVKDHLRPLLILTFSDICTLKISGESIYLDRVKCQNNAYLNYAIGSDQNSFSLLGDPTILESS